MLIFSAVIALSIAPCPPSATCLEEEGLLVIASGEAEAAATLETAISARQRFYSVFGETPVPTAIVEDIALYPGIALELRSAGYTIKPWISPGAMRTALETQLRPVLQASMADAGPEAVENAVQAAVARRLDQNEQVRHADAIIAHELGHIWLIHGFDWPEASVPGERAYGAAGAPDWMDETAAVLMESEALTAERHTALCEAVPENMEATLSRYFAMEHPMINMARQAAAQREAALRETGNDSSAPHIMVMTREARSADDALMTDAGYYYALTRAFVDYVVAETGSEAVFASLARALADGQTLDDWLTAGVDGLPGSDRALIHGLGRHITAQCAA
ncbi:hypothetical protein [Glycocaulis sp.]|uniref:hypothetical protein n=1 Tax=Glycocaulis sp. TaxID=1969725 RepID=UPI003F70735F